ncbi:hypothetical protein BDR03DRAFT_983222 [Suillus americanus]|nr:hypothetical protein BDR03DRAFT_983222 [Suillus americanus]
MALGRKFSKELLEDESDEVKEEVRKRYDEQIKGSKGKVDLLEGEGDDNDENDPDAIAKGIDKLPIICQHFACLVKKKTRFIVSFMCAGPDPRHNQDIVTLSGCNFADLYPDKDYTFLNAYQEFAELIFCAKKHDPLLPATTDVGDDNRSDELKDDGSSEEDGSREENKQGTDTMSWDNPTLYKMPDASLAPDASMAATVMQAPAGFTDASLQLTGSNQPVFYSQSQYPDWSLGLHSVMVPQALSSIKPFNAQFLQPDLMAMGYFGTMQNTSFSSPASLGFSLADAMQGATAGCNMQGWNFDNANLNSTGCGTSSLSSLLTSPTSAEHSTMSPTLDEDLLQSAYQLPTLPAANPPSLTETVQPPQVPNFQAGTGHAKAKRKSKSKPPMTKSLTAHTNKPSSTAEVITDTLTVTAAPTTVKLAPLVNSTPVVALANTAKPKAKPKPKLKPKATPINTKSSAVTEMMHIAADEGNMLGNSLTINNVTQKDTANQIGPACVSKRIPIKSRQNDIADAIRSDGLTFVGIGSKENPSALEEVGGTSSKCTADSTAECVIPKKNRKQRTKA